MTRTAAFQALTVETLQARLGGIEALVSRIGGDSGRWDVREVGDGNLNLVFIVEGPAGDLCLKQALPYVRLVGEGWPLEMPIVPSRRRELGLRPRHAQARRSQGCSSRPGASST